MTIGKKEAEAAINAIIGGASSVLFQNIRNNQHSMEKHFDKFKAQAGAAGNYPQGYFKKQTNRNIEKAQDINKLSANKQKAVLDKLGVTKRNFAKKHKEITDNFDTVSVATTSPAQSEDILPIVSAVLNDCTLYSASNDPEARFLAVAPIPKGYVGRSIEANGTKHRDCDHAVVVVNATAGSNPQVVTVFPATQAYAT